MDAKSCARTTRSLGSVERRGSVHAGTSVNQLFMRLSQQLTGFDDLSSSLAETYLTFLRAQPEVAATIDDLLSEFGLLERVGSDLQRFRSRIVENERFSEAIPRIIAIWYTASYRSANGDTHIVGAEPYFQALLWPSIRAHTPGLSGGYFGYWAYPPEN